MSDPRLRLLFLERDYFLLRQGLKDLRNIISNVETHYGVILGGEEIRDKIHGLLADTGERKPYEGPRKNKSQDTYEDTEQVYLCDIMNDGKGTYGQ